MMCTLTSWPYVQAIACIGFEPPALVAYCFTAFSDLPVLLVWSAA